MVNNKIPIQKFEKSSNFAKTQFLKKNIAKYEKQIHKLNQESQESKINISNKKETIKNKNLVVGAVLSGNRNFEGRQGNGGRTHLVSPAMAAAAAVHGHFVDVRKFA